MTTTQEPTASEKTRRTSLANIIMPQHDLSQDHPESPPTLDVLIGKFRSPRSNTSVIDEKGRSSSFRSTSQDFLPPTPKHAQLSEESAAPRFKISHLWSQPILNPLNLKSYTLPLLNLRSPVSTGRATWAEVRVAELPSQYCRNPLLATLGFFVAFLSWFAFPPLFPEAITKDLKLTPIQVANSNIVALCATLVMRLITGPAVDRWGRE
jgi:NNP family nitrate/nitrite transporter-like MFS transporter